MKSEAVCGPYEAVTAPVASFIKAVPGVARISSSTSLIVNRPRLPSTSKPGASSASGTLMEGRTIASASFVAASSLVSGLVGEREQAVGRGNDVLVLRTRLRFEQSNRID
jgi:hypothetical protein